METIKASTIKSLGSSELSDLIMKLQKDLFDLKLKHGAKQSIKTHLFKKYRRILAQLLTEQQKSSNKHSYDT